MNSPGLAGGADPPPAASATKVTTFGSPLISMAALPPRDWPTTATRPVSMMVANGPSSRRLSASRTGMAARRSSTVVLVPWPKVPARQAVRSLASCSGAATTNPHDAMAVVRKDDCWRKPQKPWLNSTRGNGCPEGWAAGRSG